jgi:hypothetical protein
MRTEVKTSISALVSEVELKVSNSSRQTVCQPKHVDYAFERCRLFSQRTAIIVELRSKSNLNCKTCGMPFVLQSGGVRNTTAKQYGSTIYKFCKES